MKNVLLFVFLLVLALVGIPLLAVEHPTLATWLAIATGLVLIFWVLLGRAANALLFAWMERRKHKKGWKQ